MMILTLFGYYGFQNLGDDLILSSLLRCFELKNELSRINVVVRENYYQDHGLTKVVFYESGSIEKRLARIPLLFKSDAALWGGGTCLYDPPTGGGIGLRLLHRNVWFFRVMGKPFAFLGIGVGDIVSDRGRIHVKGILRRCAHIWFRDRQSLERACNIHAACAKYSLGGDLAFLGRDYLSVVTPAVRMHDGMTVGFCGVNLYEHDQRMIDRCVQYLRGIIEAFHAKIYFIPFHQGEKSNDNAFHAKIAAGIPKNAWELITYDSPQKAIALLKTMDIVIGMRLHSIVLADMLGIPCIAVEYAPKVRFYIEKSGMLPKVRLIGPEEQISPRLVKRVRAAREPEILRKFLAKEESDAAAAVDDLIAFLMNKQ